MVFLRLAWGRLHASILALVGTMLIALPAFAQPDTSLTSTSTTSTTTTSTELISDWRLWAVVGAVLLVILVIALTRGKSDTTTIVK